MSGKYHLRRGTKGCSIRDEHGHQILAMSLMDAAHLLFSIKDELRRSKIGRGCIDHVHARRTGRSYDMRHEGV